MRYEFAQRGRVGDIRVNECGALAPGDDRSSGCGTGGRVDLRDDDVTVVREAAGDRCTEAATGPGDDGDRRVRRQRVWAGSLLTVSFVTSNVGFSIVWFFGFFPARKSAATSTASTPHTYASLSIV